MPFVISLAISFVGIVAATLADGRIWVGTGGAKLPAKGKEKAKRSRKWECLTGPGCYKQIANGPVVGRYSTSFSPGFLHVF